MIWGAQFGLDRPIRCPKTVARDGEEAKSDVHAASEGPRRLILLCCLLLLGLNARQGLPPRCSAAVLALGVGATWMPMHGPEAATRRLIVTGGCLHSVSAVQHMSRKAAILYMC